jgi:hypothetical protein
MLIRIPPWVSLDNNFLSRNPLQKIGAAFMVKKSTDARKRARGRPRKPDAERKRGSFAMRIRDEMKAALSRRAVENQRSISEEGEALLEQALQAPAVLDQAFDLTYGPQVSGLILLLARVIRDTGSSAGFTTTYTLDGAANCAPS